MFRCLGSHRQIEFLYEIGQIGGSAAFLKALLGSASPGPCPVLCGVCAWCYANVTLCVHGGLGKVIGQWVRV